MLNFISLEKNTIVIDKVQLNANYSNFDQLYLIRN